MEFFDPNAQNDNTEVGQLMNDLGQKAELEGLIVELREQLNNLTENADPVARCTIELDIAHAQQQLERGHQAWPTARAAFDVFVAHKEWQKAAEACNVLYLSDQPDSLVALGNGIAGAD